MSMRPVATRRPEGNYGQLAGFHPDSTNVAFGKCVLQAAIFGVIFASVQMTTSCLWPQYA
jgi:predicted anti-sigma-YlaC factor YlaD